MNWNYRIMQFTDAAGLSYYAIHEVYYENNQLSAYSATSCEPYGESMEELKADMSMMLKAFHLPILTEDDFPKLKKQEN